MNFTRALVSFSYRLEENKLYATCRMWAEDILTSTYSRKKVYFDFMMIFLVLSTVGILIYETKHPIPDIVYDFEAIAIGIFILEWLGRVWTCSSIHKDIIEYHEKMQNLAMPLEASHIFKIVAVKKIKFIFSPMSIIDLLAILPYYRPLRILRFFMLFRIFKLMRYTNSVSSLFLVFKDKKFELMILAILSLFVLFVSSSIIYIFEGLGDNPKINTFFDAIYWTAVTMSTLGYGDIVPTTSAGRVVTMLLIGGGLMVVVLATSIVTSAFSERLSTLREDRIKSDARKLKDLVIIFGYGRMGVNLAIKLKEIKRNFLIIERDEKKIEEAKNRKHLAYKSDVTNFEEIEEIVFLKNVSATAILTDIDATNLSVLLGIKAINPNLLTIVRANSKENIKKYEIAKADFTIFPHEYVAREAVKYINNPAVFDAIDNIFMERSGIQMDELEIPATCKIVGQTIEDLNLKSYRLTLIGIFRDGEERISFKPNNAFVLQEKDVLVLLGFKEQIQLLAHRLRKI